MTDLLEIREEGIYCPIGDFYIDPWVGVKKAVITHTHADHARPGSDQYLIHKHSEVILKLRLGEVNVQTLDYGESIFISGIKLSLHPAGHIIGSSQIRLEYKGHVTVISGDYKLDDDSFSQPFELVKCDTFVTESTFGLPVFQWPKQELVYNNINEWWRSNQQDGKTSVLIVYALGKAQRILKNIDTSISNIFVHGAIWNVHDTLLSAGFDLPKVTRVTPDQDRKMFAGNLILATNSSLGTSWIKKFHPYETAMASGWMNIRGIKRRRNAGRGFIISDHADWNGLNQVIKETEAHTVYITHGYKSVLSKYLNGHKINAFELETEFEGEPVEDNGKMDNFIDQ